MGTIVARTVLQITKKCLILQHCERSEQRLHFEWIKVLIQNAKKMSILARFRKSEACGQTVLPDRSV